MAESVQVREMYYFNFLNLDLEIVSFIFLRIKWASQEDNGWKQVTPRHCFCLLAC